MKFWVIAANEDDARRAMQHPDFRKILQAAGEVEVVYSPFVQPGKVYIMDRLPPDLTTGDDGL